MRRWGASGQGMPQASTVLYTSTSLITPSAAWPIQLWPQHHIPNTPNQWQTYLLLPCYLFFFQLHIGYFLKWQLAQAILQSMLKCQLAQTILQSILKSELIQTKFQCNL